METPKPQAGTWTLTAPDGRTWEASSPLHCASREQAERVRAKVAIDRIFNALLDDSNDAKDAERYRWLRDRAPWTLCSANGMTRLAARLPVAWEGAEEDGHEMDAVIDAAMR